MAVRYRRRTAYRSVEARQLPKTSRIRARMGKRKYQLNQDGKVYSFKRTANFANRSGISTSGAIQQNTATTALVCTGTGTDTIAYGSVSTYFSLNDVPDVAEFTSLFDQYKISKVMIKIIPCQTSSLTSDGTNGNALGVIWHDLVDVDDATAPTATEAGLNDMREYQNYRSINLYKNGKSITRVIKPHIAYGAYSGAFTSYANQKSGWIDCGSPTVQHYGYKALAEIFSESNGAYSMFKVETTYYLKFKNVR